MSRLAVACPVKGKCGVNPVHIVLNIDIIAVSTQRREAVSGVQVAYIELALHGPGRIVNTYLACGTVAHDEVSIHILHQVGEEIAQIPLINVCSARYAVALDLVACEVLVAAQVQGVAVYCHPGCVTPLRVVDGKAPACPSAADGLPGDEVIIR